MGRTDTKELVRTARAKEEFVVKPPRLNIRHYDLRRDEPTKDGDVITIYDLDTDGQPVGEPRRIVTVATR